MKQYSQNGEEKIIIDLLDQDISKGGFVVELGAQDGYHLSNSRYLIEQGWNHILIDADNKGNQEVKEHKITKENINELMAKYNCPKEFDFLSIDLDGNDYWILDEILKQYRPKLVVAEYNASFAVRESKTIKYDPEFIWQGDTYFGFTLEAGKKLAKKNGYKPVMQNSNMNIWLLREDLSEIFEEESFSYEQQDYFKKSERTDWVNI